MSVALNNPDIRAEILNHDLEKITNWAKRWKVTFNEGKTDLVNFTRGINPSHQLIFGNTNLTDTVHHKHLGVTLQNNCKWDEHIRAIASKVNMLISYLRTYKYRLGRKALETICIDHLYYLTLIMLI
jgi:hypothetical protein